MLVAQGVSPLLSDVIEAVTALLAEVSEIKTNVATISPSRALTIHAGLDTRFGLLERLALDPMFGFSLCMQRVFA